MGSDHRSRGEREEGSVCFNLLVVMETTAPTDVVIQAFCFYSHWQRELAHQVQIRAEGIVLGIMQVFCFRKKSCC